jgi:hypothetical protein
MTTYELTVSPTKNRMDPPITSNGPAAGRKSTGRAIIKSPAGRRLRPRAGSLAVHLMASRTTPDEASPRATPLTTAT